MRILIAGVLGGIAMFVWTSIAHMMTPLGTVGFSQIQDESALLSSMQSAIGEKPGLYMYPYVDMNSADPETAYEEKAKTNPSGLLIYHPAGAGAGMTPGMLGVEFAKETVQALIAAFLLSLTAIAAYAMRVAFVVLIGASAAIATNVSYWNWYSYPLDYTLAQIAMETIAALAAGLVIAWIVRPQTK
jgi:hypothetical protein